MDELDNESTDGASSLKDFLPCALCPINIFWAKEVTRGASKDLTCRKPENVFDSGVAISDAPFEVHLPNPIGEFFN
jgi:hypothetical protein